VYPGFVALIGNLVVAALITIVLKIRGVDAGPDETKPEVHWFDGDFSELNKGNAAGSRRATATLARRVT
jgi:hypothetical protein